MVLAAQDPRVVAEWFRCGREQVPDPAPGRLIVGDLSIALGYRDLVRRVPIRARNVGTVGEVCDLRRGRAGEHPAGDAVLTAFPVGMHDAGTWAALPIHRGQGAPD